MPRTADMADTESGKIIWPPYEAFYIQSMLFNSESATQSIETFKAVLHDISESSPEDSLSEPSCHYVLDQLQNVVLHAASLSRYFWPVRQGHEWRGAYLRNVFAMSDQSPLKSRELRNAIEHFDERLDKYLENGIVGYILPEYVGPVSKFTGVPVHLFRAYYIDSGVFELLGQRYEMSPIAIEVERVHKLLKKMDQCGGRL